MTDPQRAWMQAQIDAVNESRRPPRGPEAIEWTCGCEKLLHPDIEARDRASASDETLVALDDYRHLLYPVWNAITVTITAVAESDGVVAVERAVGPEPVECHMGGHLLATVDRFTWTPDDAANQGLEDG